MIIYTYPTSGDSFTGRVRLRAQGAVSDMAMVGHAIFGEKAVPNDDSIWDDSSVHIFDDSTQVLTNGPIQPQTVEDSYVTASVDTTARGWFRVGSDRVYSSITAIHVRLRQPLCTAVATSPSYLSGHTPITGYSGVVVGLEVSDSFVVEVLLCKDRVIVTTPPIAGVRAVWEEVLTLADFDLVDWQELSFVLVEDVSNTLYVFQSSDTPVAAVDVSAANWYADEEALGDFGAFIAFDNAIIQETDVSDCSMYDGAFLVKDGVLGDDVPFAYPGVTVDQALWSEDGYEFENADYYMHFVDVSGYTGTVSLGTGSLACDLEVLKDRVVQVGDDYYQMPEKVIYGEVAGEQRMVFQYADSEELLLPEDSGETVSGILATDVLPYSRGLSISEEWSNDFPVAWVIPPVVWDVLQERCIMDEGELAPPELPPIWRVTFTRLMGDGELSVFGVPLTLAWYGSLITHGTVTSEDSTFTSPYSVVVYGYGGKYTVTINGIEVTSGRFTPEATLDVPESGICFSSMLIELVPEIDVIAYLNPEGYDRFLRVTLDA